LLLKLGDFGHCGLAFLFSAEGAGFFDFDNDGWRDIFISTGHVYPEIARRALHLSYATPSVVYRNLGNGRFEDVSAGAGPGVTQPRVSRGCAFGDFDNDGDIDLPAGDCRVQASIFRRLTLTPARPSSRQLALRGRQLAD
jgi:hypothetical protein